MSSPASYRAQALPKRLGPKKVEEIVRRYQAGESARGLAAECDVAPSALIRLLRERNVVVKKRMVTDEDALGMAKDYEAGATMRELEAKYGLSHGAVYRALHRVGVEMRESAPRRRSA
ncbi:helix-turn-helix domain-containing protein [Humibacter ginsengiterrae]